MRHFSSYFTKTTHLSEVLEDLRNVVLSKVKVTSRGQQLLIGLSNNQQVGVFCQLWKPAIYTAVGTLQLLFL